MGLRSSLRKFEDQARGNLRSLDDARRENPLLAAMIPFTPENSALMGAGGALLGGGMALGGLGAGGAAAGGAATGAGAAAATGGGMSLGSLGSIGLGVGSIGASIYGANQAKKGMNAQIEAGNYAAQLEKESADKQLALQREIWEKQQADYKPYLEQGTWGINRLGDLMRNQSANHQQDRFLINGSRPVSQPTAPTQNTGGQLNNPLDSYLASKGVSNKFDSSNTRLDSLMKQGSGQLNNPFDSYLASKGLAGGKFDTSNPAYQFQLKQGQQALDRSSAARGMGYSGAQMKASQEYGQGLASQQYDKEYNRASGEFGDYYRMAGNEYDRANQQYTNEYNRASGEFGDYFNRLAGLSQGGQQAASSMANAGSQYANSASNTFGNLSNAQTSILGQQANARASGYTANANALSGGLNSLTNLYALNKIYG